MHLLNSVCYVCKKHFILFNMCGLLYSVCVCVGSSRQCVCIDSWVTVHTSKTKMIVWRIWLRRRRLVIVSRRSSSRASTAHMSTICAHKSNSGLDSSRALLSFVRHRPSEFATAEDAEVVFKSCTIVHCHWPDTLQTKRFCSHMHMYTKAGSPPSSGHGLFLYLIVQTVFLLEHGQTQRPTNYIYSWSPYSHIGCHWCVDNLSSDMFKTWWNIYDHY